MPSKPPSYLLFGQARESISPMVGSYAAVTLLAVYRFATFCGLSTLFLALEEADQFER